MSMPPIAAATATQRNLIMRVLHAPIWERPVWKALGAAATGVTFLLAAVSWAVRTRPIRLVHEVLVKEGIEVLLGTVKGQMVYEGLRKDFSAFKTKMDYQVDLSDKPFPDSALADTLKNGDYYFFRSRLNFRRIQTSPDASDEIMIAAITDPDQLGDWIRKPNVIFREVIGINQTDRPWLETVLADIDNTSDATEKAMKFAKVFHVDFSVSGNLARVVNVRREAHGYSLIYQQPKLEHPDDPVDYRFTVWSIQPKNVTSFPFIVSEPTQFLTVRIAYSLANLKSPHYFPAFVVGASVGNPKIEWDQTNDILQVSSTRPEWLFPGSGFILYWSRP